LIRAIGARPQVDDSFLHQDFDVEHQWDFGVDVITHFGYDWQRGRQDRLSAPRSPSTWEGDVRINHARHG
jgi:carboxypeptidase Taq